MTIKTKLERLRALPPPIIGGTAREPQLRWKYGAPPMGICQEPDCVAEATRGIYCTVHGAGFRRAVYGQDYRCQRCQKLIREGEWYQLKGGQYFHGAKNCKPPEEKAA